MIELMVREYVAKACKRSENRLTEAFFNEHIQMVVDFSDQLSSKLNADREIVKIAAYLHDISAVLDFSSLPVHAVNSSEIAKSLLIVHEYPKDRVNKVCQTILTHSRPMDKSEGSAEQVCLSNADAMAQIVNPAYWLFFAFSIRKMEFQEGIKWYRNKMEDNWKLLISPAKEMIYRYYMMNSMNQFNHHYFFKNDCFQTMIN